SKSCFGDFGNLPLQFSVWQPVEVTPCPMLVIVAEYGCGVGKHCGLPGATAKGMEPACSVAGRAFQLCNEVNAAHETLLAYYPAHGSTWECAPFFARSKNG